MYESSDELKRLLTAVRHKARVLKVDDKAEKMTVESVERLLDIAIGLIVLLNMRYYEHERQQLPNHVDGGGS